MSYTPQPLIRCKEMAGTWYNRKAMNSVVILFKPSQRRGLRLRKPPSDALFLFLALPTNRQRVFISDDGDWLLITDAFVIERH